MLILNDIAQALEVVGLMLPFPRGYQQRAFFFVWLEVLLPLSSESPVPRAGFSHQTSALSLVSHPDSAGKLLPLGAHD